MRLRNQRDVSSQPWRAAVPQPGGEQAAQDTRQPPPQKPALRELSFNKVRAKQYGQAPHHCPHQGYGGSFHDLPILQQAEHHQLPRLFQPHSPTEAGAAVYRAPLLPGGGLPHHLLLQVLI